MSHQKITERRSVISLGDSDNARSEFLALCNRAMLSCESKDPAQAVESLRGAIRIFLPPAVKAPPEQNLGALYRMAALQARRLFEYGNAKRLLFHTYSHCGVDVAPTLDYAQTTLDLAEITAIVGDHPSAERYYIEAIKVSSELPGPDIQVEANTLRTRSMRGLALLYAKSRQLQRANRVASESLGLAREVFGEDHEEVAYGLAVYSSVARASHRLDEATRSLEEALTILQELPGGDRHAINEISDLLLELRDEDGAD